MRRSLLILLALTALLGAACGGGTNGDDTPTTGEPTQEPCTEVAAGGTVSVSMLDNAFDPTCIVSAQDAALHLQNDGAALHSFTITAGDVDFDVSPGEEVNVDGPIPLQPGEHPITCKYHPEMTGTLTIEAAG